MSNWKDIESAPKDGSFVVLKTKDGRIFIGTWGEEDFLGKCWFAAIPYMGNWVLASDAQVVDNMDQPVQWKSIEDIK